MSNLKWIRNPNSCTSCVLCILVIQEQDYHFVREFVRFVASVLVKMPRDSPECDVDIILGGITALESEITWFRKEANFWQIFLERVTLLQPNKDYCA